MQTLLTWSSQQQSQWVKQDIKGIRSAFLSFFVPPFTHLTNITHTNTIPNYLNTPHPNHYELRNSHWTTGGLTSQWNECPVLMTITSIHIIRFNLYPPQMGSQLVMSARMWALSLPLEVVNWCFCSGFWQIGLYLFHFGQDQITFIDSQYIPEAMSGWGKNEIKGVLDMSPAECFINEWSWLSLQVRH